MWGQIRINLKFYALALAVSIALAIMESSVDAWPTRHLAVDAPLLLAWLSALGALIFILCGVCARTVAREVRSHHLKANHLKIFAGLSSTIKNYIFFLIVLSAAAAGLRSFEFGSLAHDFCRVMLLMALLCLIGNLLSTSRAAVIMLGLKRELRRIYAASGE